MLLVVPFKTEIYFREFGTKKMFTTTKVKICNPNKLPFLQAQILQKIYLNLFEEKKTTIEELLELTDYPRDSKIGFI